MADLPVEAPEIPLPEAPEPIEAQPEGISEPPAGFFDSDDELPEGIYDPPDGFFAPGELMPEVSEPTSYEKAWRRFIGSDIPVDPNEFGRVGTTVAGGILGAAAGSKVPWAKGPLGTVVNPVTGALTFGGLGLLAGAVAPEATMEAGEVLGVLEPGYREKYGLSNAELQTVLEGEALLEMYTLGGMLAARTGARVFTHVVGRPAKEQAEMGAKQGIMLMPVQVAGRPIARGYVTVLGRFPIIGTPFKTRGQKAEQDYQKAVQVLGERIAPIADWHELSVKISKEATGFVKETRAKYSKLYEDFWTRADAAGIKVIPAQTLNKADEILRKIDAQTPVAADGTKMSSGVALEIVQDWIKTEIIPLRTVGPLGKIQTLRQMDGLVYKVDQKLLSLEPGQKQVAQKWLTELRQSMQWDATNNVRGPDSHILANELRALDADFSHTMSQFFETATAKQFGTIRKRGLRAIEFDETTRIPVDQLAKHLIKLDSPQAMEEIARLVEPETYQQITAKIMDDAWRGAMKPVDDVANNFDVSRFAKYLGLEGKNTNRLAAVEKMLKESNAPYTTKDLKEIVEIGRLIADLPIPRTSVFVARRATIGGWRSAIASFIPGFAGIGTSTAAAGPAGGVFATIIFAIGARGISAALANPANARAFLKVLDKEATMLVRRQAAVKAVRGSIAYMRAEGEIDDAEAITWFEGAQEAIGAYFDEVKSLIPEMAEKEGL